MRWAGGWLISGVFDGGEGGGDGGGVLVVAGDGGGVVSELLVEGSEDGFACSAVPPG